MLAMVLAMAMVLGWTGGASGELGSLGSGIDHGQIGASAERTLADTSPTGKPAHEASESESERERDGDDSKPFASWVAWAQLDDQRFADRVRHRVELAPSLRPRLELACIGARGPPLG